MSASTSQDIPGLLESAEALVDARKFDAALRLADEAISLAPTNARCHAMRARALSGLRRTEDACAAAYRAVGLDPQWSYGHRLLASILLRSAERLPRRQMAAAAQNAVPPALEAVRRAPHDLWAHIVAAEAHARARHPKEADAAIRTAIRMAPRNASVWTAASLVAICNRNWDAARAAASMALAIDPGSSPAQNNLGAALNGNGRWDVAAVAFYQAAGIDPRSETARSNIEVVGFRYMTVASVFVLLPLLVLPPLFVATRLGVAQMLVKRPTRLRPLARKLGIRVATNKRHRNRLAREAAKAQQVLASKNKWDSWTSLGRRGILRFGSPAFRWTTGTALGLFVVALLVGAVVSAGPAPVAGALGAVCLAMIVAVIVWLRRRYLTPD